MPACNILRWQGAKAGSREPESHVTDLRSDRAVSGSTLNAEMPGALTFWTAVAHGVSSNCLDFAAPIALDRRSGAVD
jgi:hypothetical protein